jgi:uncharacterized protein YndB with AHSA1/START domain
LATYHAQEVKKTEYIPHIRIKRDDTWKYFHIFICYAPRDLSIWREGEKKMKIERTIEIDAPPGRIWPFFVDPEKVLQWSITFRKFQFTGEQRRGAGTPLFIEEKAGGPLMKMNFEITEWMENERLRLKMISGAPLKLYEQLWTLTPTDSGTEFTFYEEIVFPLGVVGKLIGWAGQGSSHKFVTEMQSKLKSLVEAQPD